MDRHFYDYDFYVKYREKFKTIHRITVKWINIIRLIHLIIFCMNTLHNIWLNNIPRPVKTNYFHDIILVMLEYLMSAI